MINAAKKHCKDIIIAAGVFVPLFDYMHHILQTYPHGVNVLFLPRSDQLILLALIIVPLLVLKLIYSPTLCRRKMNSAIISTPDREKRPRG